VTIKHYHADNGRFADNAFMQSVAESGQTISFCGVNAHFQNGIAEKRIRDLSEQARKQLLWNNSAVPTSVQNSETITPSVVQYMHYKINCKEEKQSQNGTNEPDSESTSAHRHDMRAQSTSSASTKQSAGCQSLWTNSKTSGQDDEPSCFHGLEQSGYNVLPPSNESTRPKAIHASRHQRSQ
jgi:hypothetical protein